MALDPEIRPHGEALPAPDRPADLVRRLHPAIYLAISALVLVFAASILGFAAANSRNYLLVIAAVFALGALALPFQLWRVQRHGHDPRDTGLSPRSFRDWLDKDIEVWGSRMRGRDAAAAILLPIASGAFGMLFFVIILHLTV